MEKSTEKRYYKKGETVWVKSENTIGVIEELNVNVEEKIYEAIVTITEDDEVRKIKVNLWEIDKNKRTVFNGKKDGATKKIVEALMNSATILFAKVRDTGIIPSKIDENGGYDVYADISNPVVNPKGQTIVDPLTIKPNQVVLIPTGIASSILDKFRFVLKERSSTGAIAMEVKAGTIDSGYRGEWFVALKNGGNKNLIITKDVSKIIEGENEIYYPVSKAIAQANLQIVPKAKTKEIPYDKLKAIPSSRGQGALGSSNK
jgi:dUTP pyrophosphatase